MRFHSQNLNEKSNFQKGKYRYGWMLRHADRASGLPEIDFWCGGTQRLTTS